MPSQSSSPSPSSSLSPSPPTFIRSDIWFTDGNIVLVADRFTFKVHRGQLQRHSGVFNDLFALPQSPSPQEHEEGEGSLFDGCAFVELYDDDPEDVYYFLTALYDGLYFSTPNLTCNSNASFPSLSAVLRLSTKYIVPHLRSLCLSHLSSIFPTTLAAWDSREQALTDSHGYYRPRGGPTGVGGGENSLRLWCPHPLLVIHLAMDMELPDLLPAAFYDLARYGPSKIMTGTIVPFGPLLGCGNMDDEGVRRGQGRVVLLTRAQLYRTLLGREHVQRYMTHFLSQAHGNLAASSRCVYHQRRRQVEEERRWAQDRAQGGVHSFLIPAPASTSTPIGSESYPDAGAEEEQDQDQDQDASPCTQSFYYITLNVLRSVGGIAYGRDADTLYTLLQALDMLERTDFVSGGVGVGSVGGVDLVGSTVPDLNADADPEGGETRLEDDVGQAQQDQQQDQPAPEPHEAGEREESGCGLIMCGECRRDFGKAVRRAREEVWRALPGWFGLGGDGGSW